MIFLQPGFCLQQIKTVKTGNNSRNRKQKLHVQRMLKECRNLVLHYDKCYIYCSGSGQAPGDICPITIQNSTQAKKHCRQVEAVNTRSKWLNYRWNTDFNACDPSEGLLTKLQEYRKRKIQQHGNGRWLPSHHGDQQRKLLCSHSLTFCDTKHLFEAEWNAWGDDYTKISENALRAWI